MTILRFIPKLLFLISFIFSYPEQDIRALWIVRDHMVSSQLIDDMVEFAEQNGFNHIFAQVRGRGDSFYNSSFVPKSNLVDINFDPLHYLKSICKNKNIKVHAWLNIYYLWSSPKKPIQSKHLFFRKPEWLDRKVDDEYILEKKFLSEENKIIIDKEGFFLAPTNPDVNLHLINVISELTQNYQIDGIHYDYIRYHSADYGYNEVGLSNFSELNNYQNKPLDENFNRVFLDFKSNAITKFVKRANIVIKNNLPNCIISAAVKPNIFNAKLTFFQEWDLWLSAGYIDWAVPMNYKTDNNDFVQNMYIIKDNLPRKFHDKIIVGISIYNQSPRSAGKKINRLKRMSFNNISIFSYSTMFENPNYWRKLKRYF
tara:strand:+ start:10308 stop:11417 length:1110 start_codon:yes stop_codon:yes gene_type:complete